MRACNMKRKQNVGSNRCRHSNLADDCVAELAYGDNPTNVAPTLVIVSFQNRPVVYLQYRHGDLEPQKNWFGRVLAKIKGIFV